MNWLRMRRRLAHFVLLGGLLAALVGSNPARAILLASYDFEGNVTDSSGNGHHGTLVGDASIVSDPVRGSVLHIPTSAGIHGVNIDAIKPIPNFPAQTSITLAAWYKRATDGGDNYRYVINLGRNGDNPIATLGIRQADTITSYSETDLPGANTDQVDIFGQTVIEGGASAWSQWHHLAVVYDRATDMAHIYLDGVHDGSASIALLSDTHPFSWPAATIGYGPAGVSSVAPGLIDEVRIFTHALSADEIEQLAAVELPELRAVVDRSTGEVILQSSGPIAAEFDYYRLSSDSHSLLPGTWNSLSDQNFQGVGPGIHERWLEMGGSDSAQVGEVYLGSHSVLDPNTEQSVGFVYNNAIDGQDLMFEYRAINGRVMSGEVSYIGDAPPDLPGDFNNDGVVNAADYTVWRNNLGNPDWVLNGNGDNSGTVDVGDYTLWKDNYGTTSPGGLAVSAQPVPEPSAIALAGLAAAGWAMRRKRA